MTLLPTVLELSATASHAAKASAYLPELLFSHCAECQRRHRGLTHYSQCEPPNWRQTIPADFLRAKVEAVIAVVGP